MTILADIADQYAVADAAFDAEVQRAFDQDDDVAFDLANLRRQRNDQLYFLYLFTRFEQAVNAAVNQLLQNRAAVAIPWSERRIWLSWSRSGVGNMPFLAKVEVLADKSRADYRFVRQLYESRNAIARGGDGTMPFAISADAPRVDEIISNFVIT